MNGSELAQNAAVAADHGREIIVTGKRDGYRTILTTTGTKTETPILDVPQSISVVTREQLDDQAIRSMSALVRLVPGVSAGQGEGHRDQITLRGNNSTADFFVDGLRDDVQYFRSFYNVDRVEIHKGSNAMIFGRGGGGGVVNRISKGAMVGEKGFSADAGVDTFGAWSVSGDANFGLGANGGLRILAFGEELQNHRDSFSGNRWAVNPVAGFALGETVRLQIGYEHVEDDRVVDRGVPANFAGSLANPATPLTGYRDIFFGVPGVNETRFNGDILRFRGEAELTDGLTISAQGLWGDYGKNYTNAFVASPVSATSTLDVQAYRNLTDRETAVGQINLEWRGDTGPVSHVLLIGAEITRQDTRNERVNGFFDGNLNSASRNRTIALTANPMLPDPIFVAGPTGDGNRLNTTQVDQLSIYVQDQIGITQWADLIAGLRYDRFEIDAFDEFGGDATGRDDGLWSPRIGLVLKPTAAASLYVSYSKSYLPQSGDQFSSLDATNAALKPEEFDNYEVGAKWNILPNLTVTAAIFQLDRTNTRAPGPVAGTTVLTGAQRSKGFELSLTGKIMPQWQAALGYGYTDAKISETTSSAPAGRRVAQVPRHQLSLWNRYDIDNRIGFGMGVYHQSRSFTSISNAVELPSYTRVDAAVFVQLSDQFDAQINVENLLGERYFPVAHNDNNISTGAPTNARFTLRFKY